MIFTKLKMNYFGRFQNHEIELKPGINLIYGENEAGKSTLHTFIRGMLFGIERLRGRGAASKDDIYTRYLPWEYPGAYGGSMDIIIGAKEYRLQRSFHANDKSFTILDLATGREVKRKEGLISELIPSLTESAFRNTISIEQLKAQTEADLAAQVRNYITNLSISKSNEVNVANAVSFLTEQRKQLELSQNAAVLKALQAEIEEGVLREVKIDQLTIQLRELLAQEQRIADQKETILSGVDKEATKRMEQFPAIIEKYRSYQELIKQENSLEQQVKGLQEKIFAYENETIATAELKEDAAELHKLQTLLFGQDKVVLELQSEKERLNKGARNNMFVSLLPCLAIAIVVVAITGLNLIGILLLSLIMIPGLIGYVLLSNKQVENKKAYDAKNKELIQKKASIQVQSNNLLHKYGVSRLEELAGRQEEAIRSSYALEHAKDQRAEFEKRQRELEDQKDILYETIMKYVQHFIPEEELTNTTMQTLQEAINSNRQLSTGKLTELNRLQESRKLQIEKLRWEIGTLEGNEEELLKNQERYSELEQKQKENATLLEAVKLALTSIQELGADIHDSFGQQLNVAVSEVISEVTGKKYTDLKVDEKLEVKVGWKGAYVLLERLSAGTIDQVYFALRIAVADLLLGKDGVPLLLDDSFALYDELRVRAALLELSQRKQVILFTCHKRERVILEELGLQFNLIDLSC